MREESKGGTRPVRRDPGERGEQWTLGKGLPGRGRVMNGFEKYFGQRTDLGD